MEHIIRCTLCVILFSYSSTLSAQDKHTVTVLDSVTHLPVAGANLWYDQTDKGAFTDDTGHAAIEYLDEHLYCSHIRYSTRLLDLDSRAHDTVYLVPTITELDDVVISKKASNKRKQYIKRFKSAMFGKDKAAKGMTILNPEALLFSSMDNTITTANKATLLIDNVHLGYNITAYIEFFEDTGNKSSYAMKTYFESYDTPTPTQIKNRTAAKVGSYNHFMLHFMNDTHLKAGYMANLCKQNSDGTLTILAPAKNTMIHTDSTSRYIATTGLIQVINLNEVDKITTDRLVGTNISNLGRPAEKDMISQESRNFGANTNSAQTSFIFLPRSKARIDKLGNPTRFGDIVLLGYWQNEGLAQMLPAGAYLE